MDKEFLAEMLERYYKHLETVVLAINGNIKNYEKSIEELTRLVKYKPETYQKRLDEMNKKVIEADIKLSHLVPRMEKIQEQLEILKK